MSENPRIVRIGETEQEKAWWEQLFRIFRRATLGAAAASLVLFVALGFVAPEFPIQYMLPVVVLFMLMILFSLWLSGRGHRSWAIAVYAVNLTVPLFVATYLTNGVTGPMVVGLVVVPLQSGILGGRRAARMTTILIATVYLVLTVLEVLGAIQPFQFSGLTLRVVYAGMFVAVIAITATITSIFVDQGQRALSAARQRERELAEASSQAERAAQAEREAREREEKAARELRRTIQAYTAFLERIASGDYSARLALDGTAEGEERPGELVYLGRQLNATVESLVQALSELQVVQRRYAREAWGSFVQTRADRRGFRYQAPAQGSEADAVVEPADEVWLEPMPASVQSKDLVADQEKLALPITLRGEVIGAVGARREGPAGWSDEDLALATAITDQLAQTLEGLRLLDETQRRAAREQLIGQVAARVRETMDVETVLETAARELQQALDLEEVEVRLGSGAAQSTQGEREPR